MPCSVPPAPRDARFCTAACASSTRRSTAGCSSPAATRCEVVPAVAAAVEATAVHVSADFGPYGSDATSGWPTRWATCELVATGSPYAVSPGSITKSDGTPYRVFTPFERAWRRHGWRAPARTSARTVSGSTRRACAAGLDTRRRRPRQRGASARRGARPPAPGGESFRDDGMVDYAARRDRPDRDATSRLSPYLKFGCLHPRTVLADLDGPGSDDLAHRTGVARVLRRRAVAPPGHRPPELQPPLRHLPLRQRGARGQRVRRLVRGPHRIPDRRRRHAAAARRGLDAQPGADDHRVIPDQGPTPAVVVGRTAFHAAPRRRRPGLEPARLAVDRRHRHRRRPVLPGLQPDRHRAKSSIPRAITCAAGCPSCAASRARRYTR